MILLAVVLVVGTTVVVSWSNGWFSSCDIPESIAPDVGLATPEAGGLRVVEQGFSYPANEWRGASVGAMLENTSDSIAYHTKITFTLLDADNQGIVGYGAEDDLIPIIMPHQRIGVGETVYPATPVAAESTVTGFRVNTETAQWLPSDALGDDYAPVTAEYRGAVHRNHKPPNTSQLHFVTKTDNCRPMRGWSPIALFRDGSGTLIGGTNTYVGLSAGCTRPGVEKWVTVRGLLPDAADDARTELYPYCDIQDPPNPRTFEPAPTSR
ncbi:hypothetical protein [Actinokineospora iranica]|uniref:hypothetical protein n=1 Tax=Actinokineospora iranica TaxID=1271860 RepID=UPI000B85A8DE|nr:hypothetical protein [Actinokineospora iranica]